MAPTHEINAVRLWHTVYPSASVLHEPDRVEPESDALALSDILQMGDEIDGGGLQDGQDGGDDDDDFQDGDHSHPGGNSNGRRR